MKVCLDKATVRTQNTYSICHMMYMLYDVYMFRMSNYNIIAVIVVIILLTTNQCDIFLFVENTLFHTMYSQSYNSIIMLYYVYYLLLHMYTVYRISQKRTFLIVFYILV